MSQTASNLLENGLSDFARLLKKDFSVDEIVDTALEFVMGKTGASGAAIYRMNDGIARDMSPDSANRGATVSPHLRNVTMVNLAIVALVAAEQTTIVVDKHSPDYERLCEEALDLDKMLKVGARPPQLSTGPQRPWMSFIGVPMFFSGECKGVLIAESDRPDHFSLEHKALLETLCPMIASAISWDTYVSDLGNATRVLATSRSDVDILQNIVTQCAKLCRAETCSLFLYESTTGLLVLRADYGHDRNLSNRLGPENRYAYDGKGERPGATWDCLCTGNDFGPGTKIEIEEVRERANRLWPDQWNDSKVCHSFYLRCIMDSEASNESVGSGPSTPPPGHFGVLKVENKLDVLGRPKEDGGFSEQDKFIIKLFADATAMLVKSSKVQFGKPYLPEDMFGKDILQPLSEDGFMESLRNFDSSFGEKAANSLKRFSNQMKMRREQHGSLAEYSNIVVNEAMILAKIFHCEKLCETLLTGLRNYEVILKEIPAYRNHFVHQFNVFLLGCVILAKQDCIRNHFINEGIDLQQWFLASMFHDSGLPIEKLNQAFQAFVKETLHVNDIDLPFTPFSILSIEEYHNVCPIVEKAIRDQFVDDEVRKAALSALHGFYHPVGKNEDTSHNHSVVSASLMCKNLDEGFDEAAKARIVTAILFHEARFPEAVVRKLEKQIKASKNRPPTDVEKAIITLSMHPLAFLLGFCDFVQNWGRPEREAVIGLNEHDDSVGIKLWSLSFPLGIWVALSYTRAPKDWDNIYSKIVEQAGLWVNDLSGLGDLTVKFVDEGGSSLKTNRDAILFTYRNLGGGKRTHGA